MLSYTMIAADTALQTLLQTWKQTGTTTIAMDFEGEFNLHKYGEHLCLIQLFDGSSYYLIDPFSVSVQSMKQLLEDPSLEKIMFDCASDSALVRKQYGIMLEGVYDIRVSALALGYTGNLSSLVERYIPEAEKHSGSNKKKNQMTNWLVRPLKADQIQYALSDVEHLFTLKACLVADLQEKGLQERVEEEMRTVGKSKGPDKPGWEKFSSWKYLSREEKVYLKNFFIARDTLAQKYDVPAVRILEKHLLLEMAKQVPSTDADFHIYCGTCTPRRAAELIDALKQAKKTALSELGHAFG
ncbi:MAG: HRDC domain-containing protein [Sphaerochaeta sp.]|uniref:HRDC domain-containing protein n=1 Tax=Sphaerochaeta sp. TaxID=1972642 RepID=UPI002FC632FE